MCGKYSLIGQATAARTVSHKGLCIFEWEPEDTLENKKVFNWKPFANSARSVDSVRN